MLNNTHIRKAAQYLEDKNQCIVIIMHTHPDGDAVGSSLGLYDYLLEGGWTNVYVIAPDAYASFLHWMPRNDSVIIADQHKARSFSLIRDASLLFCLDFNGFSRSGQLEKPLKESGAKKIMIDHHPQPEDGFDLVFSETAASSTAELIYEFISASGDADCLSLDAAQCLYAGIVTDTGSFSYGCNNPRTYQIVARLIEKGVDGAYLHRLIYSTYTADRMRLLGYCLQEKLNVFEDARAAYISLSQEELQQFNHQEGDTEGVVNYALAIKNIYLAALFIEKEDHVKASFRSAGDVDVNQLARKHYAGGGHKNAAGGKSFQSLVHTEQGFIALINKAMLSKGI